MRPILENTPDWGTVPRTQNGMVFSGLFTMAAGCKPDDQLFNDMLATSGT